MIRGKGYKKKLILFFVTCLKFADRYQFFHNTPSKISTIQDKLLKGIDVSLIKVFEGEDRIELEPKIWNHPISKRFSKLYQRSCPEAFVTVIPMGMVAGESSNWIIFSDNTLSRDLSREFGAYGGLNLSKSKLINGKLKFKSKKIINGKVAVISTCGYNNFHHWNYDCIPRLYMLQQTINLDEIDLFIIHHSNYSFQNQSLDLFGISKEKIIQLEENQVLQAEMLYVPSLPSNLGTVSPWVVKFLRNFYVKESSLKETPKYVYISRKNVSTRKIINNNHFQNILFGHGFIEIFPEDYSVSQMAEIMRNADVIISIHGSGLSNICFINSGTTVIDILAPFHQDGYYWQISNICNGNYIGFFAEGDHPDDNLDLVKANIDSDIYIDIHQLKTLLKQIMNYEKIF